MLPMNVIFQISINRLTPINILYTQKATAVDYIEAPSHKLL